MLQEARKTGKPFDPMRLDPGCLQVSSPAPAPHCLNDTVRADSLYYRSVIESPPFICTSYIMLQVYVGTGFVSI